MPVTEATHDLDTRTLTIVAEFATAPRRLWEVYADPRQLERVWGPPGYPATFAEHDLAPGGRMHYYMTGPEGEKYYGFWEVETVDAPNGFTFRDGFAVDDTFAPNPTLPVCECVYSFTAHEGGTRATYVCTYPTVEGLQTVLEMGAVEGTAAAFNQIDQLVAA